MLSWSVRRRLIYAVITLMILAIIAVTILLLLQNPPSCFDGKQNQDEVGVDCGGSCSLVCSTEIVPLKILWSRLFDLGAGKYDVVALVKNPNLKHGASDVEYTFRLWDKDNLLINSKSGKVFINPKEDLAIFASRVDVGKKTPVRVSFELDGSPVWQKIDREAPQLTFSNKRFENEPVPRLMATVKNNSLLTVKNIEVAAILSDLDQNAVAVSSTFVESLAGGESQDVSFSWPRPFASGVSFIDLAAHFDWRQLPVPQAQP